MTGESKKRIIWKLFYNMLFISTFTFGGGFVIITFMKKRFVDELQWIHQEEMLDLAALAQSAPGAIAVNASILVGWKVAGFAGMLAGVCGTIIPPMLILSIISFFYTAFAGNMAVAFVLKGMQAGVAAVILDVVCELGANVVKSRRISQLFILAGAFIAAFVFKVNVIYIIIAAMVIGFLTERRTAAK